MTVRHDGHTRIIILSLEMKVPGIFLDGSINFFRKRWFINNSPSTHAIKCLQYSKCDILKNARKNYLRKEKEYIYKAFSLIFILM